MTNLNNSSMATVVETFIVEETSNLIHDGDALKKWNEKVEELGLEGQKTVVVADKSPIPFLWMNEALIATFETLCPSKIEVEKYDKTPIPLEILDLVALSKKEQYFQCIEIWYNEKEKDPVCIGYKYAESEESDWYKKYRADKYLIGRWADVKASLDQLIQRAKQLFVAQTRTRLTMDIKYKQRELEDLESVAEMRFGGLPATDNLPF
jgi:hypothetical protein